MFKATFIFLSLINPPTKRFSILIISTFLLLLTSACDLSFTQQKSGVDLSENTVDVFIQPNGAKPLIFLKEGGTKICRRGLPDEKIYGLDPEENTEQQTEENAEQDPAATPQRTTYIISTDVKENWFQMGLLIVNKSNSYFLIIEQLKFVITARWGDKTLKNSVDISSGYCGSDPLYIIPPTPTSESAKTPKYRGDPYQPFKKNHVNNLTLFVNGVPIPDEPPTRKKEGSGSDTLDETRATQEAAETTAPNGSEEFILTYLPPYKVRLIISGYWIDKSRNSVANFIKEINFSLASQFLN